MSHYQKMKLQSPSCLLDSVIDEMKLFIIFVLLVIDTPKYLLPQTGQTLWELPTIAIILMGVKIAHYGERSNEKQKKEKLKLKQDMLRCFGCTCYPYLRDYNKHKFAYHSSKCVFIGYSPSHKGYKCLHASGKIYIARHVVFYELTFPYTTDSSCNTPNLLRVFKSF